MFLGVFKYLFIWSCRVLVAAGGLLSCGMRTFSCSIRVGSSSLTRDQTQALSIGSAESYPLCHQGSPRKEAPYSQGERAVMRHFQQLVKYILSS